MKMYSVGMRTWLEFEGGKAIRAEEMILLMVAGGVRIYKARIHIDGSPSFVSNFLYGVSTSISQRMKSIFCIYFCLLHFDI